jgi:protein TonB
VTALSVPPLSVPPLSMAAVCPATGQSGPVGGACPWTALETSRRARLCGWIASAAVVVVLAAVVGQLGLLAAPSPAPFAVGTVPAPRPAAMPLVAIPEPAPAPPQTPLPPTRPAETAPVLLSAASLPPALPVPAVLPAPKAEAARKADTAAPPPLRMPEAKAQKTARPKTKEAKPAVESPATKADMTAAQTGKTAGQGDPAAWAASVASKIRKTARNAEGGRGTVQIGFTVAKDGSLAAVKVLVSSGDVAVDAMGLDHIRRAAPFGPPPEGSNRNLAFAFELR